jgi:hypothetical protein
MDYKKHRSQGFTTSSETIMEKTHIHKLLWRVMEKVSTLAQDKIVIWPTHIGSYYALISCYLSESLFTASNREGLFG